MNLLPKGITLNGFILPQETDRSIFDWMAAQSHMPSTLSSAQAIARKDYFLWIMGRFESLVESVKLEIRGFEKVALKQFCAQAPW